jgi:hypothetical protein
MRLRLIQVLLAVAALSSMLDAAAEAATWTTNGSVLGTPFTATSGAAKLTVSAPGFAAQGITCTTKGVEGTVTKDLASWMHMTIKLGGICLVVGQTAAVKCSTTAVFTAASYNPATNVTSGAATGISCVVAKTNGACGNATTFTGGGITVTGSVPITYGNTSQQLVSNPSGQALSVSWSGPACLTGTGTGTATGQFTNASGTASVDTMNSVYRPQITG